ncbi:heterodisulfide reductase, subunit B [Candidatus Methanoperedens nitroreducens]|uniref:Heterodisulfide reductase, subunit B n=1 Tax=Candidatus Methanoperedens nitratireducens TaxID=1392998 RepID=A0A062UZF6_9EURY|nr:CoB--CoM heterodisulfide reductase iron-sulfur subunit B family protein [Candidatus Methanoperedens nitroreducens]KCZ70532.1 heterodisulfide reductase, subunit B [Candidatus Methanoperedens nitroreducens]MDJ1420383.1 CoB--CoM heterodisulfide reductase iron-sulfur subunit B family protein [Candidatus Methanoperedens sp.]
MKYSYYPGCAQHGTASDYRKSVETVFSRLGIELEEIKNWNCCGTLHVPDKTIRVALSARNLASSGGLDLATPCNLCYSNLMRANTALEDAALKNRINEALINKYDGNTKPKHLLEVIVNDYGLTKLSEQVKKPMKIKAVPYYGCLLTRPENRFDSPENPVSLDNLIISLGAEPVKYYYKTKCCGGPILLTNEDIALGLAKELLVVAKESGADCMVVTCPMCHLQLDAKQRAVESKYNIRLDLPVIYFTQLIGLAMGLAPSELGMNKHLVSTDKLIAMIGR